MTEFFTGGEVVIIKEDGSRVAGWVRSSIPVNQGKDLENKNLTDRYLVVLYDSLGLESSTKVARFCQLRNGHLRHSKGWGMVPVREATLCE